ncbi:putative ornithine carbamoyl transferase [Xylariomycetidae sp. FL0641]|nr:putative ornithine carbamoyl transferase [Xylariomycetidae sp. FL0641]
MRPPAAGMGGSPIRAVARHLLSIADLNSWELKTLVHNANFLRYSCFRYNEPAPLAIKDQLRGQTIAMMFNKRSTRTRVSTEAAVTLMGGHPMFLGRDDIQLGVNESLRDTATVISSMTSGLVARVGPHQDVVDLARWSQAPVINALSDDFHPLQAIADILTIFVRFKSAPPGSTTKTLPPGMILPPDLKIAWVGDANNVLFDLAMACMTLGVQLNVATPKGYEIPHDKRVLIDSKKFGPKAILNETNVPEEAVKDADFIITDTWISMGQEADREKRLKDFEGFQVTEELAARGGASPDWRFMHCLPRHSEEVSDEVFYGDRSLVWYEAKNRLWAALAVLEAFVVKKDIKRLVKFPPKEDPENIRAKAPRFGKVVRPLKM